MQKKPKSSSENDPDPKDDQDVDFDRLVELVEDEHIDELDDASQKDSEPQASSLEDSEAEEAMQTTDRLKEFDDSDLDELDSDLLDEDAEAKVQKAEQKASQLQGDGERNTSRELASEETAADRQFREKMKAIGDEPKVAMFGFKSAGKSWLLHRLRHHIFNDRGAPLEPSFVDLPDTGEILGGTSEFEIHQVIDRQPWSIIDSPGEYSRLLIDGKVEDMWQLVHVLANASAIVIAVPADVLVFGAQMEGEYFIDADQKRRIAEEACGAGAKKHEIEEVEEFIANLRYDYNELKRFGEGLFRVAGALSFVRHKGLNALDPEQYADVNWQEVLAHIRTKDFRPVGGLNGLTCPCFIALTKSDRLMSVLLSDGEIPGAGKVINDRKNEMAASPKTKAMKALAERSNLFGRVDKTIARPSMIARQMQKALHTQIVRNFPMSRFDYVSAFFGHDYSDQLDYGHYDLHPDFGVSEMFDWIRRALILAEKGDKRISQQVLARKMHFAIHGIPSPGSASIPKVKS